MTILTSVAMVDEGNNCRFLVPQNRFSVSGNNYLVPGNNWSPWSFKRSDMTSALGLAMFLEKMQLVW